MQQQPYRIAFDGSPWERPPHSMRRVLGLLLDAAVSAGWSCELWTRCDIQPEYAEFKRLTRVGPDAWKRSKADLLWCPWLADKPTRLPLVSTIHDVNPLLPDGRPWPLRMWRRLRFRITVRASIRRSWRVVTDTRFAMESVTQAFPELLDRVAVIPLFADSRLQRVADPERDRALAALGVKPGYILFLGSLRRHKNWDGLLRAYAALPQPVRSAHRLLLAGPAHRAGQEAHELARALGVHEDLTVLGTVHESAVSALYSGAALFAFPSFMEGFGLPPLEAMACGTPVVASDRTSIPEVLGDAAVYADPADPAALAAAMLKVLGDSSLAADLVKRGAMRVASYSPTRTAEAMRPIVMAALAEKTLRGI